MLSENIERDSRGRLQFAGCDVERLSEQYGTPLYLMDEQRIRENCRRYRAAFRRGFGENAKVLYASKAASFREMYRIVAEEGMGVDAVSSGEIFTAVSAGFPASEIYFHGNCKTDEEIRYAVSQGVGCFVVDNEEELHVLEKTAGEVGIRQKILLRVTPGIDPHTYEAVNTGRVDSKFGAAVETGQAMAFVKKAAAMPHLDLRGLHCHVGSQVFGEDVYLRTIDLMAEFLKEIRDTLGLTFPELNLGGGYGVRYKEDEPTLDLEARILEVAGRLKEAVARRGLPLPCFLMEPGRSIVADAGMTVYTVGMVKRIPGYKNYVAVDGGMGDNPRYALYGAQYTVLHATKTDGEESVFDLVGRFCESGDIIQPAVSLPDSVCRGDRVAVCTTGAYNYSMASNYNRIPRPPVVMLRDGESRVAVRRETIEDLAALDE